MLLRLTPHHFWGLGVNATCNADGIGNESWDGSLTANEWMWFIREKEENITSPEKGKRFSVEVGRIHDWSKWFRNNGNNL